MFNRGNHSRIMRLPAIALLLLCLMSGTVLPGMKAYAAGGTPWEDSSIRGDFPSEDTLDLKDDFYLAVNRPFLMERKTDPETGIASAWDDVNVLSESRLQGIATDPALTGNAAALVRHTYAMLMDYDTRNALGIAPGLPYLQAAASIGSIADAAGYEADPERNLSGLTMVRFAAGRPAAGTDRRPVVLARASLSLKDPAEYTATSPAGAKLRAYQEQAAACILERAGFSEEEIRTILKDCMEWETLLASHCRPDVSLKASAGNGAELLTAAQVRELAPDYPLEAVLEAWGFPENQNYLVPDPGYLSYLGTVYDEDHWEGIRAYYLVHTALSLVTDLDETVLKEVREADEAVYGPSAEKTRSETAMLLTRSWLPEALQCAYAENYLTDEERDGIRALVRRILDSYEEIIRQQDWMSRGAKKEAIRKLDRMTIHAVMPEQLPDQSALKEKAFAAATVVQLHQILRLDAVRRQAQLVETGQDPEQWDLSVEPVSEANAWYSATDNTIHIPGGILEGIYYAPDQTVEQRLGGIGSIIGHEVSHAFDPSGAAYNADGKLSVWWNAADRQRFHERAQKIIRYYNGMIPDRDFGPENGSRICAEAIADLGGMKCTLQIAETIPGFDYNQYFCTYAGLFARKSTREAEWTAMMTQSYPLDYLRCNTVVQQFEEFYTTYGISEGDGMYLAPEGRIGMW